MKYIKHLVLAVTVFVLLGVSTNAQPLELFAVAQQVSFKQEQTFTTNIGLEQLQTILYSIDPETGIPTAIGPTGFKDCFGLDFDPITNNAYAVCDRLIIDDPFLTEQVMMEDVGQVLIMLDILSGQGTEIGPLGLVPIPDADVTDISFRADGTLFGIFSGPGEREERRAVSRMIEFDEVTLITIDTTTGQASEVGPTGTGPAFGSIAFSPSGSLYHATDNIMLPGVVNMLDHQTGAGTQIDDLDYPPNFDEEGIIHFVSSIDYSNNRDKLYGMLVSQGDRAVDRVETGTRIDFAPGSYLHILDPQTGSIELIGLTAEFGNQFAAIAFLNRFERNVPTLSEYGLLATSIFLLLAAVFYLRKRKIQTEI